MTRNDDINNEAQFDREVYEALRAAGCLFPQTPAEVERAEQELAKNPIELASSLSNAAKVFDLMRLPLADRRPKGMLQLPHSCDARGNLAQAAREGGEISKELLDRMHKDRRKAGGQTNGQ